MPGAGADLEQHLDVEVGARLEPLRLEQLARRPQLRAAARPAPRGSALTARSIVGALGDEVLGRVDGAAVELRRSSRR